MTTPTPDRTETPPAAPLTAEEIAARAKREMTKIARTIATAGVTDPRALRDLNERFERASAEYRAHTSGEVAALRDRLARAEAERDGLRALMNEWEHQGSTRSIQYRDDLCERWLAALATPTDGAARAGDAAGGE